MQTASLRNNSECAIWWKLNANILKNFHFLQEKTENTVAWPISVSKSSVEYRYRSRLTGQSWTSEYLHYRMANSFFAPRRRFPLGNIASGWWKSGESFTDSTLITSTSSTYWYIVLNITSATRSKFNANASVDVTLN